MPVAVTTKLPLPRVTVVLAKTMSMRSARAASASTASTCLSTGVLSPVKEASSVSRLTTSSSQPSAGTRSPWSTSTTLPGTSSSAGKVFCPPALRTMASGRSMSRRAASPRSALLSWLSAKNALNNVMANTTAAVDSSPMSRATIEAPSSTSCNKSLYWRRNARQQGSCCSWSSSLDPYCSRRRVTSPSTRPDANAHHCVDGAAVSVVRPEALVAEDMVCDRTRAVSLAISSQ